MIPIGSVSPIATRIAPVGAGPASLDAVSRAGSATSFSDAVQRGLESVSRQELQADALSEALASGQPVQIHEVMAATTKAQLSVDLLVQVRNKAVDAYREIMNLQV